MANETENLENDPLWYKDAIIYEVHIKAFYDSDGDGTGDLKGLTMKLDYLKNLGITAIWLLPFYPSPHKDDGYDIADYHNVHASYGTLRDFKELLRESHKRGIRIITELVLNHTSDQHPWFQASRKGKPGSNLRNFYVWSDSPGKYKEARIIFRDFETSNWAFDHVAKAYFWHRFYSHQPDLNYEDPNVKKAMMGVVDFWLKMGVDGLRLDAVPYLFERDGTNCENLPETHEFLRNLRTHIDKNFTNKILLAEANQWPEDAIPYFGKGDECNMAFHFPLMPRMFMALQMEDRFPVIEILEHIKEIPQKSQWAIFLRNHDELTLEMVTDEERDYMYRMYARDRKARLNLGIRRRLSPLLNNDKRKIELMNVLLFTLPGAPVIYYGDEIGMGDNYYLGDRNGVRTPMQWSADINAGFSKANPQRLYLPVIIDPEYHYETVNVDNQSQNMSSVLWSMKRFIAVRKRFKAFGRGSIKFLLHENNKVLSYIRAYEHETILVTMNLSRYSQMAKLDLSKYEGMVPQEVFGGTDFPVIGKEPYALSFGRYGYYIFDLKKTEKIDFVANVQVDEISIGDKLQNLFVGKTREKIETIIFPNYIKKSRWFGGKSRRVEYANIKELLLISTQAFIILVDIHYKDGFLDTYLLPVAYVSADKAKLIMDSHQHAVIAKITMNDEKGLLCDGVYDETFRQNLLQFIYSKKTLRGIYGAIQGTPRKQLRKIITSLQINLKSFVLNSEQSNTSIVFEDKLILKLVRRLEEGVNPELEISEALTQIGFENSPKLVGDIKYSLKGDEPIVTATLHEFVKNHGGAWKLCLEEITRYFERVLSEKDKLPDITINAQLTNITKSDIPEKLTDLVGQTFLELAKLLGKRTAEFHTALIGIKDNPDFEAEPFGYLSNVSLTQSMISYAERVLRAAANSKLQDEDVIKNLHDIITEKSFILERFAALRSTKIDVLKGRTHGDYHLGQVLYTGDNFVIIDFEGEPARSLSERRLKKSPLRDVAGMIRSFHYAAYAGLFKQTSIKLEDTTYLEKWANLWYKCCAHAFLQSYMENVKHTGIVQKSELANRVLLEAFLLEKALYELDYEINNRPEWVMIPVKGIKEILGI